LGDDLAVAELEEHGGVAAHLAARGQRAERDGQDASPEDFEGNDVSALDFVGDFVGLAGENLAAFFEGFWDLRDAAAEALGVDAVGS
jgi:hypothetical protein